MNDVEDEDHADGYRMIIQIAGGQKIKKNTAFLQNKIVLMELFEGGY